MCVRFEAIGDAAWREDKIGAKVRASGSMFPGSTGAVVVKEGQARLAMEARWGLVPFWARDANIAKQTYNARAETVAEKPSFREAFRRRRCYVPASAFYERWEKHWWRISLKTEEPFAMAGLYELANNVSDAPTFTVITTEPNALVGAYHDRMPVILTLDELDDWLDPHALQADLEGMLRPFNDDVLHITDAGPIGRPAA
ncbi:MAG: SOS response-associated peptidase [Fimbriimonadaceae bacterium]